MNLPLSLGPPSLSSLGTNFHFPILREGGLSFPGLKRTRGEVKASRIEALATLRRRRRKKCSISVCIVGLAKTTLPSPLPSSADNIMETVSTMERPIMATTPPLGGDCKFKLGNILIEGASARSRSRQMQHDATSNMSRQQKKRRVQCNLLDKGETLLQNFLIQLFPFSSLMSSRG